MSALKLECEAVSNSDAILLDNFPKLLSQSEALDACFGKGNVPCLAISLTCELEVNLERFLARGRGSDDVGTFRRRLQRFEKESPAVIGKYRGLGQLVEVSALGTPEEVFATVVGECEKEEVWRKIFAADYEETPKCLPFAVVKSWSGPKEDC